MDGTAEGVTYNKSLDTSEWWFWLSKDKQCIKDKVKGAFQVRSR